MQVHFFEIQRSMERVKTLVEKLKQLLETGATADQMLRTAQMLVAELNHLTRNQHKSSTGKASVVIPAPAQIFENQKLNSPVSEEEKVFEILQVDEEEIEKELAELKKQANGRDKKEKEELSVPVNQFDPITDVPTLAHQPHVLSSQKLFQGKIEYPDLSEQDESLNDKLKQLRTELSESLSSTPIKDLKKAIGINDRFLFINELFRNDEAMYERSIKTIQNFSIYAEAEFWIRRELRLKLGWSSFDQKIVRQFDDLVRRRFM